MLTAKQLEEQGLTHLAVFLKHTTTQEEEQEALELTTQITNIYNLLLNNYQGIKLNNIYKEGTYILMFVIQKEEFIPTGPAYVLNKDLSFNQYTFRKQLDVRSINNPLLLQEQALPLAKQDIIECIKTLCIKNNLMFASEAILFYTYKIH